MAQTDNISTFNSDLSLCWHPNFAPHDLACPYVHILTAVQLRRCEGPAAGLPKGEGVRLAGTAAERGPFDAAAAHAQSWPRPTPPQVAAGRPPSAGPQGCPPAQTLHASGAGEHVPRADVMNSITAATAQHVQLVHSLMHRQAATAAVFCYVMHMLCFYQGAHEQQ